MAPPIQTPKAPEVTKAPEAEKAPAPGASVIHPSTGEKTLLAEGPSLGELGEFLPASYLIQDGLIRHDS